MTQYLIMLFIQKFVCPFITFLQLFNNQRFGLLHDSSFLQFFPIMLVNMPQTSLQRYTLIINLQNIKAKKLLFLSCFQGIPFGFVFLLFLADCLQGFLSALFGLKRWGYGLFE